MKGSVWKRRNRASRSDVETIMVGQSGVRALFRTPLWINLWSDMIVCGNTCVAYVTLRRSALSVAGCCSRSVCNCVAVATIFSGHFYIRYRGTVVFRHSISKFSGAVVITLCSNAPLFFRPALFLHYWEDMSQMTPPTTLIVILGHTWGWVPIIGLSNYMTCSSVALYRVSYRCSDLWLWWTIISTGTRLHFV